MCCGKSKCFGPVLTVVIGVLFLQGCRGRSPDAGYGGDAVARQEQDAGAGGGGGKGLVATTRPAGEGPFVLKGIEVVRAELARPHTAIDAGGEKRQYTHAHVVLLEIEGLRISGPALEVLIGDYKVPEYGGWERGIYFKVYEAALLEKLAGHEMRWRFMDRTGSFGRRFEVPQAGQLVEKKEAELFPRVYGKGSGGN
jgi:hypothetical protein